MSNKLVKAEHIPLPSDFTGYYTDQLNQLVKAG